MIESLASISAENWATIFNYVTIGLIVLVILAGVIGFFKGIWKTTFHTVMMGIFLVLIIVFNHQITKMIYEFDLGAYGDNLKQMLNIPNSTATNIGDLGFDYLVSLNDSLSILKDPTIIDTYQTLTMSILSFVVFICDFLLVLIVGKLLCILLYHCLFKFIIPKRIRKKKKLKPIGAVVNMVQWIAILCIGFSPFTALLNTMNNSINSSEKVDLDDDFYNAIINFLQGYNNSTFGQVLTSVKSDDGKTLDIQFMDYLTNTEFGDNTEFVLSDTISSVLGAVDAVYQTGALSDGFEYTALLEKEIVNTLINELGSLTLVHRLLPVAISLALNIDSVKDYTNIDPNDLDFSNVDWEDELHLIGDVYGVLYDANVIDSAIGKTPMDFHFYEENRQSATAVLLSLDNSEFFKIIMPPLVAGMAQNELLIENGLNLNNEIETYEDIKWGTELAILYNKVVDLDSLYLYQYEKHLDWSFSNADMTTELTNLLMDQDLINGVSYVDANGDEVNLRGTKEILVGKMPSTTAKALTNDDIFDKGILDMDLIYRNIGLLFDTVKKVPMIQEYVDKGFIETGVFDEIENELNGQEDSRLAYKREFSVALDCASILINNPNLPLDNFDFTDQIQRQELKKITKYLDQSIVFTKIAPGIIEGSLNQEDIIFGDITFGDLDFRINNFGTELGLLIDTYDVADDLLETLDKPDVDVFKEINFDDLEIVLQNMFTSRIFNNSKKGVNRNFKSIVKTVLDRDDIKEIGFVFNEAQLDELDKGNGWTQEISSLCGAFKTVQNAESLNVLFSQDSPEEIELTQIDSKDIEDLFAAFDRSELIRPSLGTILNKNLKAQFETLGGKNVDFTKIQDWTLEGQNLAKIIDSIKTISEKTDGTGYFKLDEINWLEQDSSKVKNLLVSLYETQTLGVYNDNEGIPHDNFAEIVHNMLIDNIKVYGSADMNDENSPLRQEIFQDFMFRLEDEPDALWYDEENPNDENSEINKIVALIDYYKSFSKHTDESGNIDFKSIEDEDIHEALTTINNIYPLRSLLPDVLQYQIDNLNIGDLIETKNIMCGKVLGVEYNYKSSSPERMVNTREEEVELRQTEIDYFCVDPRITIIKGEGKNVPSELQSLTPVKAMVELKDVFKDGNEDFAVENFEEDQIKDVKIVLEATYQSRIFNYPDLEEGEFSFFEGLFDLFLTKGNLVSLEPSQYDDIEQYLDSNFNEDTKQFETKGEISLFTDTIECLLFDSGETGKAILASSSDNPFKLEELKGEDLERIIAKIDSSKILRPSLPVKMNENALIELQSMGAEYANFDFVSDWTLEGQNFGEIADALNAVLHEGDDEFGNPIYQSIDSVNWLNVDKSELQPLLEKLAKTQVLGTYSGYDPSGAEHDHFADIILHIMGDSLGSYINDESNSLDPEVKKDFYFRIMNQDGREDALHNNISWDNDGEIAKLIQLINLFKENNLIGDNQEEINLEAIDGKALNDILQAMNDSYILRTVFVNIMNNQIASNTSLTSGIEGLDLSKTYPEVLKNELNMYANDWIGDGKSRENEINLRRKEIEALTTNPFYEEGASGWRGNKNVNAYDQIKNFADFMKNESLNMNRLDEEIDTKNHLTALDSYEVILRSLYQSRIFNMVKDRPNIFERNSSSADKVGDLTFFEQVILLLMNKTGLMDMGWDASNPYYEPIETISSENRMVKKIIFISDNDTQSESFKWFDDSDAKTGVIDRLFALIKVADDANIDASDNEGIAGLDAATLNTILTKFNECFLTNEVVTVSFKNVFENIGINSFRIDSTEDKTNPAYFYFDEHYETYGNLSNFNAKVIAINEEIEQITSLYMTFGDKTDAGDFEFNAQNFDFASLLVPLGNSKILSPLRADFLYTMLDNAHLGSYISEYTTNYVGDEKESAKRRRDTISYLEENKMPANDNVDGGKWKEESDHLTALVHTLSELRDIDDIKSVDSKIAEEIITSTFSTDQNVIRRGYLTSEIVANFLNEKLSPLYKEGTTKINWRDDIPYGTKEDYCYEMLNKVEASGLRGLIDFVSGFTDFKESLEALIKEKSPVFYQNDKECINTYNGYRDTLIGNIKTSTTMMGAEGNGYDGKTSNNSIVAKDLFENFKDDLPSININISFMLNFSLDFKTLVEFDSKKSFQDNGKIWSQNIKERIDELNPYKISSNLPNEGAKTPSFIRSM